MKFYPETSTRDLTAELTQVLHHLRAQDHFDAKNYVQDKAARLNSYMAASALSSCVVAVSGGIDSALVLALVYCASKAPGSPIKRIVPVLLPVHTALAATNQDTATLRGQQLCERFGLKPTLIDLTTAHAATKQCVDLAMGLSGEPWASGQLVAYQRTPALYYVTALLNQSNCPGLIVGTTNYDEGAYLGFFGKASDGLVDVQLISDLHKRRVFEVAAYLDVPVDILAAQPTGDMYDGRIDEEVFGASYDFVELFLRTKREPLRVGDLLTKLDTPSQQRFHALARSVEELHGYNAHKYLSHSPAVHLDLWDWSFEGSWVYRTYQVDSLGADTFAQLPSHA